MGISKLNADRKIWNLSGVLLLLLVAVSVLFFGTRFYLDEVEPGLVLPRSSHQIETTFSSIEIHAIPLAPRSHPVVLATRGAGLRTEVLAGDRTSGELFLLRKGLGQGLLSIDSDFKNLSRGLWPEKSAESLFLLDIASMGEDFYVSSVAEILVGGKAYQSCALIRLHKISMQNLISLIWQHDDCIPLASEEARDWYDLQGRITTADGRIFLSTGMIFNETYQGTYPNRALWQPPSTSDLADEAYKIFGKVLEIDPKTGKAKVIAKGLRAPSGLALDSSEEGIFIMDHGPRGGDELNYLRVISQNGADSGPKTDFGWPLSSLGDGYEVSTGSFIHRIKTEFGSHAFGEYPIFAWTPAIAPSQLVVLEGDSEFLGQGFRAGDLVVSSLKAQSLFHVRLDSSRSKVIFVEQIYAGFRIRDIDFGLGGLVASSDSGQILLISLGKQRLSTGPFPPIDNESPIYDSPPIKAIRENVNSILDFLSGN